MGSNSYLWWPVTTFKVKMCLQISYQLIVWYPNVFDFKNSYEILIMASRNYGSGLISLKLNQTVLSRIVSFLMRFLRDWYPSKFDFTIFINLQYVRWKIIIDTSYIIRLFSICSCYFI